jgi:DNA polymerase-1
LKVHSGKRTVVIDAEANGLLQAATKIWIIVARDYETGELFIFCDNKGKFPLEAVVQPIKSFNSFIENEVRAIVGHNIVDYDVMLFYKLLNLKLFGSYNVKRIDTMIMSKVLDYKRFGFGHSLDRWGQHVGVKKPEHEDWSQFSQEMVTRCIADVDINVKVYAILLEELNNHKFKDRLRLGLKVEHGAAEFVARAQYFGFPFDIEKARKLEAKLAQLVEEFEAYLLPKLLLKVKPVDGYQLDKNFKSPRWLKDGSYVKATAEWFGIGPLEGHPEKRPIWGDYCRITVEYPELASPDSIKDYLFSIGWEPDDWNYKKVGRELIKQSPKITETSLKPLGHPGWVIDKLLTTRARLSIVRGWLELVTPDGRLHGDSFVIGTPTGRMVHKIIANIPKADSEVYKSQDGSWIKIKSKPDMTDPLPWLPKEVAEEGTIITVAEKPFGPQFRELFTVLPGYKMVGADSSGNQFRALCHYLGPEAKDYTEKALSGDVHVIHQNILKQVEPSTTRGTAKPWFYAFLFGGGDGKSGLILTGKRDSVLGKKAKSFFANAIPGLKKLLSKITKQLEASARTVGFHKKYIPCIDGRPVYVDSDHKGLNYLLQSCEKVTCAAAVTYFMDEMDSREVDWQPLILYHDELAAMVEDPLAEEVAVLAKKAFKEAPKWFGIEIMDGSSAIGTSWKDVH